MTGIARAAPLDAVPDWADGRPDAWLDRTLDAIRTSAPVDRAPSFACAGFSDLHPGSVASALGWHADPAWRRFALGLFAADLACYATPGDQVTFDRLSYVVSRFPQGFRLWWRAAADGAWLPVGYTGWYPVTESTFSRLEAGDPTLADRLIPPERELGERPFIYVFNYSVEAPSRRSALSRSLMQGLASDLAAANPAGLSAITVSPDGIRNAERLGMARRARLDLPGLVEWIFVGRFGS